MANGCSKICCLHMALHGRSKRGRLKKNSTREVASFFGVDIRMIQRIWKTAKEQIALGLEVDVSNKKIDRFGRKKKFT